LSHEQSFPTPADSVANDDATSPRHIELMPKARTSLCNAARDWNSPAGVTDGQGRALAAIQKRYAHKLANLYGTKIQNEARTEIQNEGGDDEAAIA
jgi:hypothetical protein